MGQRGERRGGQAVTPTLHTLALFVVKLKSEMGTNTTRLRIDFGIVADPLVVASLIHRQLAKVGWIAGRQATRSNGQLATSTTTSATTWGDNWGSLSRSQGNSKFFFLKIILIIFTVFQSLLFYLFLFFLTCHMRVESEYQNRCVSMSVCGKIMCESNE